MKTNGGLEVFKKERRFDATNRREKLNSIYSTRDDFSVVENGETGFSRLPAEWNILSKTLNIKIVLNKRSITFL